MQFPIDYQHYLSHFGTGWLGDFFLIWNPFSTADGKNWLQEKEIALKAFKGIQNEFLDFFSQWVFYPAPGGLLPCGTTVNGDTLFWVTTGQPDQWTISAGRDEPLDFYNGGLCEFLYHKLHDPPTANLPDLRESPKNFCSRGSWERFK